MSSKLDAKYAVMRAGCFGSSCDLVWLFVTASPASVTVDYVDEQKNQHQLFLRCTDSPDSHLKQL